MPAWAVVAIVVVLIIALIIGIVGGPGALFQFLGIIIDIFL